MERRKFIVSATGALAGMAIGPAFGMVAIENGTIVSLPKRENHIRHGLFTMNENDSLQGIGWISKIARHRFYENGHSPEENDLYQTSLSFAKGQVTFNKNKNQLWVLSETEAKSFDFSLRNNFRVYSERGIDVFATRGPINSIHASAFESMLILPFKGNYRSYGRKLNENQALLIENGSINPQFSTEEITLIIVKNG